MSRLVSTSLPSDIIASTSSSTTGTFTITTTKTTPHMTTTTINNALFRVIESPTSRKVSSSGRNPIVNDNIQQNTSKHFDINHASFNISKAFNPNKLFNPSKNDTLHSNTSVDKGILKNNANILCPKPSKEKVVSKENESFVVTCEVEDESENEMEHESTIIEISNDKVEQSGKIDNKKQVKENDTFIESDSSCTYFHERDPKSIVKTKRCHKQEKLVEQMGSFANPNIKKVNYLKREDLTNEDDANKPKTSENKDILKEKGIVTTKCKLKIYDCNNSSYKKRKKNDEDLENKDLYSSNKKAAINKNVIIVNEKSKNLDDIFDTNNFVNIKVEPSDFVDDEFKAFKNSNGPIRRKYRKVKMKKENNSEVQCQICNKKFRDSFNLHRHIECRHTNKKKKKNKIYKCESCKNSFRDNYDLERHKKCCTTGRKKAQCIYPGCDLQFFHMISMIKHLKTAHDTDINTTDLVFDNYDSFLSWKEVEQDTNLIFFTKRHGSLLNKGTKYISYICQVDGPLFHETEPRTTSRRWSKGQVRKGIKCPARMLVKECENTGKVTVKYITTHNHAIAPDINNLHSKDKLKKGLNIESEDLILETSPRQALEELQKENYSSIIVYKPQSQPVEVGDTRLDHLDHSSDLFVLGWQTQDMRNLMLDGASKILCVDSTYKTNQYGYQLLNLIVPDSFGGGQPVAHFITTHLDQETLEIVFNDLKEKCPEAKIDIVMTDDDNNAYNALNTVFGSGIVHLLCHAYTKRIWMRKIKLLISEDQLKAEVYTSLEELLYLHNEDVFESMKTIFIERFSPLCSKFVSYITKSFFHHPETWAMCYRKYYTVYSDTSLYVEAFHIQLKNFNRKRKSNKTVDDLVLFLLDLDKIYSNEYERRKEAGWTAADNGALARHLSGLQIPDSDVCQLTASDLISEGIWKVESQIRKSSSNEIRKTASYEVMANVSSCALQQYRQCREVCSQDFCTTLCEHQYTCTCDERSGICKHIHKVHSMMLGKNMSQQTLDATVVVENELPNNWELIYTAEEMHGELTFKLEGEPSEKLKEVDENHSIEKKVHSCRSMLLAIMDQLDNPLLQMSALDQIHTSMQKLTTNLQKTDDCDQSF